MRVPLSFNRHTLLFLGLLRMNGRRQYLRSHLPIEKCWVAVVHELGVVFSLLGIEVVVNLLVKVVLDSVLVLVHVDHRRLLPGPRQCRVVEAPLLPVLPLHRRRDRWPGLGFDLCMVFSLIDAIWTILSSFEGGTLLHLVIWVVLSGCSVSRV